MVVSVKRMLVGWRGEPKLTVDRGGSVGRHKGLWRGSVKCCVIFAERCIFCPMEVIIIIIIVKCCV